MSSYKIKPRNLALESDPAEEMEDTSTEGTTSQQGTTMMSQQGTTSQQDTMSQHSESPSSYFSIISDDWVNQLQKLDDSNEFCDLHAQFWGTPVSDFRSKNKSMDIDVGGVDEEKGNEDTGKDNLIDSPIDSGDYILDVGLEGRPQIYVRKEYDLFYNICKAYLKQDDPALKILSVVITGQPGIGKSYWSCYAMCRHLSEREPVLWYGSGGDSVLFVEEGVFIVPQNFPPRDFKIRIWTLVDSNYHPDGVPPHLIPERTNHLIIFTTPPQLSRWKPLRKSTSPSVFYMNPWTRREILKVAVIHRLENKKEDILNAYDQFGPTPQICLEYIQNNKAGLEKHEVLVKSALQNISPEKLRKLISDVVSSSVAAKDLSHILFLIKRWPENEPQEEGQDYSQFSKYRHQIVKPITLAIEEELVKQFTVLNLGEQFHWYSHFMEYTYTSFLASIFFKVIIHRRFQNMISLNIFPMKVEEGGTAKRLPPWKSAHTCGDLSTVSGLHLIKIHPAGMIVYPKPGPETIELDIYYVPESKTQVGFDSFIRVKNALYIFQVTLVLSHEIEPGILTFFNQFQEKSLLPDIPWYFVFVLPHSLEISCHQPKDHGLKEKLQAGMRLFSAVKDVEVLKSIMTSAQHAPGGMEA